jgi:AcrR family transcriptional regulator
MTTSPSRPRLRRLSSRRTYHHGDLRRALLDAAVQLIEAQGLDAVSVRGVAKMVGVSAGAPFRHFASRTALLTGVAEQAMDRLEEAIDQSLREARNANPLMQLRAIGTGVLGWVIANPTRFQVISARAVIDFEGSSLRRRNDAIRAKMSALMNQAAVTGLLRSGDTERYQVAARALVYGLSRMFIDGQFPSWNLNESSALEESVAILDQFISCIKAQ